MYGVKVKRVRCYLMGDLMHVRHDIIQRRGRITAGRRLPFLSQIWEVNGDEWKFSDDEMRLLVDQLNALQVFVADPE